MSGEAKIAVIVALVTIVGAIVTSIFSDLLSTLVEPEIGISLMTLDSGERATIEITNRGLASATNLSLFVVAPREIEEPRIKLSTVEIESIERSGTLLTIRVPNFVEGEGAKLFFEVNTNHNSTIVNSNYSVYAIYDQGSVSLENSNSSAIDQFSISLMIITLAASSFYAVFVLYFLFIGRWNLRKRRLKTELLGIRGRILNNDADSDRIFNPWTSHSLRHNSIMFPEPSEYARIDDVYRSIAQRELLLVDPEYDDVQLMALNHIILKKTEDALEKIQWNNGKMPRTSLNG